MSLKFVMCYRYPVPYYQQPCLTFGSVPTAFSCAGPSMWKVLPDNICSMRDHAACRILLKTHYLALLLTFIDCSLYSFVKLILQNSFCKTWSSMGMYRISGSGSGWPDIRPFFAIRFRFRIRPKYCLSPDSATG